MSDQIKVKQIPIEDVYPIRHLVLRKGKPFDSCKFDNDLIDSTAHFGVFHNNKLCGVATILKSKHREISEVEQHQLRGMAVLEAYQGKSLGSHLIKHIQKTYINSIIWCNAREIAVPFYKKNQFKIISTPFHIPKIGLHYVMHT